MACPYKQAKDHLNYFDYFMLGSVHFLVNIIFIKTLYSIAYTKWPKFLWIKKFGKIEKFTTLIFLCNLKKIALLNFYENVLKTNNQGNAEKKIKEK